MDVITDKPWKILYIRILQSWANIYWSIYWLIYCWIIYWCNDEAAASDKDKFKLSVLVTWYGDWLKSDNSPQNYVLLISYSPLNFRSFFSFQHSFMVNRGFHKSTLPFARQPMEITLIKKRHGKRQLSKDVHPKLSTASCGIMQVFFIVSYAQSFQNTLIPAIKLLNPTHLIQCFVLQVTVTLNVGEVWLKLKCFGQELQKLLSLSASDIFTRLQIWENFLLFFLKRT